MRRLLAKVKESRPVRAWQHYGAARGNLLAGGMAYTGLFTVVSSLVVGFTVLGTLLSRRDALRRQVVVAVDAQLPGLLDVGPDGGLVPPQELFATDVTSWTGIVALAVALVTGLGWLEATRGGIRIVYGYPLERTFLLLRKLKDAGVMATLGVAVLASAALSLLVNAAAGWLLRLVGLDDDAAGATVLRALAVLLVFVVDAVIFMVFFRLLAGLDLPWRVLRSGALVGAAGAGVLKLSAGLLLGRVGGSNPLLASSAVLAGLLVWMNLLSRVTLLATAWVATRPGRPADAEVPVAPADGRTAAGAVGRPPSRAAGLAGVPTYGQRAADRTTLAAGAVLGALALGGVRAAAAAARSLRELARSRPD